MDYTIWMNAINDFVGMNLMASTPNTSQSSGRAYERSRPFVPWVLSVVCFIMASPTDLSHAADKQSEKSGKATQKTKAAKAAKTPASYIRLVETDDNELRLDMAARTFVPIRGKGPSITLVAAIHVGDKEFYQLAQLWLDAQDLVLFEGVGEEHMRDDPDSPEYRIEKTKRSVRFTAIMIERYKRHFKTYPKSLDELVTAVKKFDVVKGARLRRATRDAWAKPLAFKVEGDTYELISFGPDGKRDGKKAKDDLRLTDLPKLTRKEIDPQGKTGIQADIAGALGLVFQLHAFDTGKANYRNSDMSITELRERIAKGGGDMGPFMGMMDGSSLLAGVLKFGLGIVRNNPQMQTMLKVMMMETLSQFGDDIGKVKGVPPTMQKLFRVLIEDRNQTVVDDLKDELGKKKKAAPSIAIWYGAGHMRDLELRLREQLKYKPVGGFWIPAITVDLNKAGVSKQELERMRKMLIQLN